MNKKVLLSLGFSVLSTTVLAQSEPLNLSANSGFDTNSVIHGSFKYSDTENFTVPNWIFSGSSGIANNNFDWGGEAQTTSLAFIQGNSSSVSQIITSNAKKFKVSFDVAQRRDYTAYLVGKLDVYFDNKLLGSIEPVGNTFERSEFITEGLPTSIHSLTFRQTVDGDATVFVDNIEVIGDPIEQQNRTDQLQLGSLSLTRSNGPSVEENYVFSNCSFVLENTTGSLFPDSGEGKWVSIDFFWTSAPGVYPTSYDQSIGDIPFYVSPLNENQTISANITNPQSLYDLARIMTTFPDRAPTGEFYVYAQMRRSDGSIGGGAFSSNAYTYN